MSKVEPNTHVHFTITFKLDEVEARALDALVGYGVEAFLQTFYSKLGRNLMEPYEAGLSSFFLAVEEQVRPELERINRARKLLTEGK